jgi:hypothetical protein
VGPWRIYFETSARTSTHMPSPHCTQDETKEIWIEMGKHAGWVRGVVSNSVRRGVSQLAAQPLSLPSASRCEALRPSFMSRFTQLGFGEDSPVPRLLRDD